MDRRESKKKIMRIIRSNIKQIYFLKSGKVKSKIHGYEKSADAILSWLSEHYEEKKDGKTIRENDLSR